MRPFKKLFDPDLATTSRSTAYLESMERFWNERNPMIDYRVENNPVKTSNESFDYGLQKKGKALISIPSRAENDVEVKFKIDWKNIGIDPLKATIIAREVKNFQLVKTLKLNERIPVEKG